MKTHCFFFGQGINPLVFSDKYFEQVVLLKLKMVIQYHTLYPRKGHPQDTGLKGPLIATEGRLLESFRETASVKGKSKWPDRPGPFC